MGATTQKFFPGKEVVIESVSPISPWAVVFEDDGATGYLYAVDHVKLESGGDSILEAMHIYNAENVTDADKESEVSILWSADGLKICLLINDYPHAVFDFDAKRGYCRNNFPKPLNWTNHDFRWDDRVLEYFRK